MSRRKKNEKKEELDLRELQLETRLQTQIANALTGHFASSLGASQRERRPTLRLSTQSAGIAARDRTTDADRQCAHRSTS